ncbi:MAG: polymer-forming cytoskeletal protein [Pseudomonadota bacterium]|nr:polymer-forming cytoskeletal protein [Pseudomonadota bacterium]
MNQSKSQSYKADVGRRMTEIPGMARSTHKESLPRKLLVGNDITLSGEISSCDHLSVEGTVEATVRGAQTLDIADGGSFKGTVEVETANIAGNLEGDVTVQGLLKIHGSGRVSGKIGVCELEIERGGRIEGEVAFIDKKSA